MASRDAPLFEYRIHPPKKLDAKNRVIPSGPPLIFRFLKEGGEIGVTGITSGGHMFRVSGARAAELFEIFAEHLRGPMTSDPDRLRATLVRIAAGNPDNEEYADLELR